MADIGNPKRTIIVEPLEEPSHTSPAPVAPVPSAPPSAPPVPTPAPVHEPEKVPV